MTNESRISRMSRGLNNAESNNLVRQSIIDIYSKLISEYSKDRILSYIERTAGVEKNIVELWFGRRTNINIALAEKIALNLKNFNPKDLVGIPNRLVPPLAPKKE